MMLDTQIAVACTLAFSTVALAYVWFRDREFAPLEPALLERNRPRVPSRRAPVYQPPRP